MSRHGTKRTPGGMPTRRRRRPVLAALIAFLLVLGLVVAADRLAAAYAENRIAVEIQKQGFGAKPDVTIEGFPFLAQVLDRYFPHARMTARGVRQGPLTIDRIEADVRNVRTGSDFREGTIGSVDGTATVAFGDLARATDQPGLRLSAAGRDTVKAEVDLGVVSGTMTWQVTTAGRNGIRIRPIPADGFDLTGLVTDLDFTIPLGDLPMGLTLRSLSVSRDGVRLRVTGSHIPFSG